MGLQLAFALFPPFLSSTPSPLPLFLACIIFLLVRVSKVIVSNIPLAVSTVNHPLLGPMLLARLIACQTQLDSSSKITFTLPKPNIYDGEPVVRNATCSLPEVNACACCNPHPGSYLPRAQTSITGAKFDITHTSWRSNKNTIGAKKLPESTILRFRGIFLRDMFSNVGSDWSSVGMLGAN